MGYLAVSVVTMVFNGMVLKWGETEGQNRLAVMSVNYLFASLGTASVWMVQGGGMPSPLTLLLGPLGGIFYGTGLFLWIVESDRFDVPFLHPESGELALMTRARIRLGPIFFRAGGQSRLVAGHATFVNTSRKIHLGKHAVCAPLAV